MRFDFICTIVSTSELIYDMFATLKPYLPSFQGISFLTLCLMASLKLASSFSLVAAEDAELKNDTKQNGGSTQHELLKVFVSELVAITPGKGQYPASFLMGDETKVSKDSAPREIQMKELFSISKYETPQNLYQSVMSRNPSRWKGSRNSVEMMSFDEAQLFCERMTQLLHKAKLISEDEIIRLPTEAEWEYCCRAGSTTKYSFGDSATKEGDEGPEASVLSLYAWHTGNAAGNDPAVGELKPNSWGLYDMHGYLWEFVVPQAQAPNPKAVIVDTQKRPNCVLRGGSWRDHFSMLTCGYRRLVPPNTSGDSIGFRCVKAKGLSTTDKQIGQ